MDTNRYQKANRKSTRPMQVTIQSLFSDDDSPVVVETNAQATAQTLISSFCTQKGIPYSTKYGIFDAKKTPIPIFSTIQSAGIMDGQDIYIGYRNNAQNVISRWALYIALAALIIGAGGILIMSLTYGLHGGSYPFVYGVVMDAGSSKTKTYLYHWLGDKFKGTGLVERVEQVDVCTVKKGIAKHEIKEGVQKVIDCGRQVTKSLDENVVSQTPLYFAATAGMRILNMSDPDKMEQLLHELKTRLNETGLSVRNVRVISGRDEGIFAWITSNFLENTLDKPNTVPWTPITYGALDMGGASLQIAFELPPKDENINNIYVENMTLFGERHDVFAKSYLCFGRDEANKRYQVLLLTNPNATIIEDPCAPVNGQPANYTGKELFQDPCTTTNTYDEWISKNESILNTTYSFIGTNNYELCKERVRELTNETACLLKGFKECLDDMPRPIENQKYLAFASYFYTANALGLTKSTLEEYESGTKAYCEKPRSEINDPSPFAEQYCFNAVYIRQMLISAYGFNSSTWSNLEFIEKVGGKDLGWPLGYMINATNAIDSKKRTPRLINPVVLTVCLLIFIIMVMAAIIFVTQTILRKKKNQSNDSAKALYESP